MLSRMIKTSLCAGLFIAQLCMSLSVKAQNCDLSADPISCTVKIAAEWIQPTSREDGSPLTQPDISKYQLVAVQASGISSIPTKDVLTCGQCWDVPASNTTAIINKEIKLNKADVIDDGNVSIAVAVRTFDDASRASEWTDLSYVDLVFPQEVINQLVPPIKKTQLLNVVITFE